MKQWALAAALALPATALAQFACRMDLGHHGWIERLAQRAITVGVRLEVADVADIPTHASQMRQAMQQALRIPREAARAHAQRFGWDEAARLFRGHLVPARAVHVAHAVSG